MRGVSTRRRDVLSQPDEDLEEILLHGTDWTAYISQEAIYLLFNFIRDLHRDGWRMSDAPILQVSSERLIWHCPEPCSAFGGHILRGHVQITYPQHSTLFDPFGGSDFFLNLEDRLQDHYGKDDSLCNIEGKTW